MITFMDLRMLLFKAVDSDVQIQVYTCWSFYVEHMYPCSITQLKNQTDFPIQASPEFTHNGVKNKKHPVSGSSVGGNYLLKRKIRGVPDLSKLDGDWLQ